MHIDVQQLVSHCMVCDRVRGSFNAPTPQLHPLLIMGLGYHWSLDFERPLPLTVWHNRYVLLMVEHISKWIELVPSLDKSSEGVLGWVSGLVWQGVDWSLNHVSKSSWGRWFSQTCGTDGEKGIAQVWLAEGPSRGLGYSITVVGHGISI